MMTHANHTSSDLCISSFQKKSHCAWFWQMIVTWQRMICINSVLCKKKHISKMTQQPHAWGKRLEIVQLLFPTRCATADDQNPALVDKYIVYPIIYKGLIHPRWFFPVFLPSTAVPILCPKKRWSSAQESSAAVVWGALSAPTSRVGSVLDDDKPSLKKDGGSETNGLNKR